MRCTRCGADTPAGAKFCPNCAAPVPAPPGGVSTGGGAHVGGNARAGRDFVGRDQNVYNDSSGMQALANATGAARALITAGLLLAFAGFGIFAYGIVSVMIQGFSLVQSGSTSPPDFSILARSVPLGFGLMFAGIVIANVGLLINRRRRD
jgi:hypothetical protein